MSQRSVFTSVSDNKSYILSRGKDILGEVIRSEVDLGFCGEDVYYENLSRGLCRSLGFLAVQPMGCRLVLGTLDGESVESPLRVATSFPALSRKLLKERGYAIASIQEFGGKVEGKLSNGNYNAIVDIIKSGETALANEIVERDVLIDDLQVGMVYQQEPTTIEENVCEFWQFLVAMDTLLQRKRQLDEGAVPDTSRKNSMLLLSDENRLAKAIGEEAAELVRAMVRSEGTVNEAADNIFTTLLAPIRDGYSGLSVINELIRRNRT